MIKAKRDTLYFKQKSEHGGLFGEETDISLIDAPESVISSFEARFAKDGFELIDRTTEYMTLPRKYNRWFWLGIGGAIGVTAATIISNALFFVFN
jgi:hypothetical protein